jgi:outer membrane protein assembly factor BamA
MRKALRFGAAALALGCAGVQAELPVIREIVFEGNDTTQPRTMLREMLVRPGDPADEALIERSRQGVQNLGLFREVSAYQEPIDGGVRLVIRVREKYYAMPSPRADYNSDGQYGYGLQIRWANLWGLNHKLRGTLKYKNGQEPGRGTALELSGGYYAPFVLDSPYGLELSGRYSSEPIGFPAAYDELTSTARLVLTRSFRDRNPAGQSWTGGLGMQWQEHATQGPAAPPPIGHALALVLDGGYGRLHDNLYSETGQRFSVEAQSAGEAFGSDYAYTSLAGGYDGSWTLAHASHQTFGVFARAGAHRGGTLDGQPPFELGGVDSLRGYRLQVLRGTDFYYGGFELLRPLRWNWLRGMAFVEAGDVSGGPLAAGGPYADIGIGLRARLTWFVDMELSVGVAWPLSDSGDGRNPRFFAGGYR